MADVKKKEVRTPLKKTTAEFMLIGEVKINDFTFKIDQESTASDWVKNVLNLGVDCGNGNIIYAGLDGGYGSERENVLNVHGIKENDKKKKQDDWDNKFTIAWEDRLDETILETIGEMCFIKIGIEKQVKDKQVKDKKETTYIKKFLSAYDAVAYVQECLKDGMVVNVKGDLKYSIYNGSSQVKKEIKSIFLSKVEDPSKYKATFTQTICVDKDSVGKLDKDKAVFPITARVIDYTKLYNDKLVKSSIGFFQTFELEVDKVKPENTKNILDKLYRPKKNIDEITVEGELIEGNATVAVTEKDLPEDIRDLISMGVFSLEDALSKLVINGPKEKRMIIKRPLIKMVGKEDEDKKPIIVRTLDKYKESDFFFDFMIEEEEKEEEDEELNIDEDVVVDEEELDLDDTSWMAALGDEE